MTDDDVARVAGLVQELGERYPDAVAVCGELVDAVEQDGMESPEWCWLPMMAFGLYALVATSPYGLGMQRVSLLAALTEWQLGRGLYRPDPDAVAAARAEMYAAAGGDPGNVEQWHRGKPPSLDALVRLPEWCCYVTMPTGGHQIEGIPAVLGVFVHLDYDPEVHRPELRLVVDCDGTCAGLVSLAIALDEPDLELALRDTELSMRDYDESTSPEIRALFGPYVQQRLLWMLAWAVLPLVSTLIDPGAVFIAANGTTAQPERAQPHHGVWRPAAATRLWRVTHNRHPTLR